MLSNTRDSEGILVVYVVLEAKKHEFVVEGCIYNLFLAVFESSDPARRYREVNISD